MQHSLPALRLLLALSALTATGSILTGQISYVSGTYTQDFNTLPVATVLLAIPVPVGTQVGVPAPTLENPAAVLLGWSAAKTIGSGTTAAADFIADDGARNSGALRSAGTGASTERALGALASGSNRLAFGVEFVNNTGGTLTSVTVSFTSEFWRSSTSVQNIMAFGYAVSGGAVTSANYLTDTTMIAFSPLDVVGPLSVATNGALDGNLVANQVPVSATLTGISVPNGSSIYLRWNDLNDEGNDSLLAIDDFSFSAFVDSGSDLSIGGGTTFTPTNFAGTAFTSQDTAVFNGAATTITLAGDVLATALKFPVNGYTLAGGITDSIDVAGAITVDTDATTTISGVLAGEGGINKLGAGTLVLSGANTVSGSINILAGRLVPASDAALGNAENDVLLGGVFAPPGSNFTLGAGRTLSGAGEIAMVPGSTFTMSGPVSSGALTISGPTTLNFAGVTNSIGGLTVATPVAINATGGALQLSSGALTFNQTSGTSTLSGGFTNSGDRGIFIGGGTVQMSGNVTLGGRIIKTGPGTLDLSTATVAGATPTSGGFRLGIQGGLPVDGGTLKVGSDTALGNFSQLQLNTGTLEIVGSIVAPTALSIGGRTNSSVPVPTITGGNLTLAGTNGYFNAGGSDGDVLVNVNNVTTLTGNFNPTSSSSLAPIWVGAGGTGTLVIAGDARRLIDNYIVTDSVTLVIDGTLGGQRLRIESGATVSGSGTFSGSSPWEDADANPSNNLTLPATPIYVASEANVFGTLAPSGVLTIRASTTLESSAAIVLSIDGATRGTQYSALAFEIPPDSGFAYSLSQNGTVTLDFGSPAVNGSYDLISTGAGVTRSGGFSSVSLAGSHTGALTKSGPVWSGTSGGASFSFNESTGLLTITGGATATSALQDWRQVNFGSTVNTGTAANSADFDNDGIANLIEYATGSDPTVASASPTTLATTASGEFLTLSFTRINDPALSYVILASNDVAIGFTPTGTTYTGGPAQTLTYTDTVPLTTPGVRRFLRLQVSSSAAE